MVEAFEGKVTRGSWGFALDWAELVLTEVRAEKEGRGVNKESAEEAGEGELVETKNAGVDEVWVEVSVGSSSSPEPA